MDSQENTLELGTNEEVVNEEVASQAVETEPQVENEEQARVVYETKEDVLRRLQDIAHSDEIPQKEEVEYLKASFYKLHIAEREAKLKAYLDAGGDPEQYFDSAVFRQAIISPYSGSTFPDARRSGNRCCSRPPADPAGS